MNKRYDLEAESAYSQSTGTLADVVCSRSLIDFADESFDTSDLEAGSQRQQSSGILMDVELAVSEEKEQDQCSDAGHLWHRRKRLSTFLNGAMSIRCSECQRRVLSRKTWTCLAADCRSKNCNQCKKMEEGRRLQAVKMEWKEG